MAPKTIILTGASRGIGWAIAQYLLSAPQSNNLVVLARTQAPLQQLKDQYSSQVEFLTGDVTNHSLVKEAVQLAVSSFGQLDGLVVNHGTLGAVSRIVDCDPQAWKEGFDVNFISAVSFVKEALPELRKTKGKIIFTSSGAAVTGYTGWGLYGSSKAAMNHFALTLASEEPDVTSISVRPGMVDTQMQQDLREIHMPHMDPNDGQKFLAAHKDGKLLKPEQPGHVMAKLVLNAPHELSGKFLSWNDKALEAFQE